MQKKHNLLRRSSSAEVIKSDRHTHTALCQWLLEQWNVSVCDKRSLVVHVFQFRAGFQFPL